MGLDASVKDRMWTDAPSSPLPSPSSLRPGMASPLLAQGKLSANKDFKFLAVVQMRDKNSFAERYEPAKQVLHHPAPIRREGKPGEEGQCKVTQLRGQGQDSRAPGHSTAPGVQTESTEESQRPAGTAGWRKGPDGKAKGQRRLELNQALAVACVPTPSTARVPLGRTRPLGCPTELRSQSYRVGWGKGRRLWRGKSLIFLNFTGKNFKSARLH